MLSVCVAFLLMMTSTMKSSLARTRTIVWFRNDLRVLDNPVLSAAVASTLSANSEKNAQDLLCVYCFDPRHFRTTRFGSKKTAAFRAQFLLESVSDLRSNLRALGGDLLVSYGRPENVLPLCLEQKGSMGGEVFVQGEVTSEEQAVEASVEQRLHAMSVVSGGGKYTLRRVFGSCSLYHPDDLPFQADLRDMPNTFTPFKEKCEKRSRIRELLPALSSADLRFSAKPSAMSEVLSQTASGFDFMPTLSQLMDWEQLDSTSEGLKPVAASDGAGPTLTDEGSLGDARGVMSFTGGETAARVRLEEWAFRDDNLQRYFEIRNGMLGEAYSSKLSPWLAHGCISPRYIYNQAKRYERERRIANKSTYWLVFELIWRDFFRYICAKHGRSVFLLGGAVGLSKEWSLDEERIRRWKTGTTGMPLVDANMRELLHTGWMSNRGRQNVASYLVLDLGVDWRVGADHFESLLLDHDVCSNYGNWNAAAGLLGGRVNRFNIVKQSKDYDAEGAYIRHWLPELQRVPAPLIFEPWKLSERHQLDYGVTIGEDYPAPLPTDSSFSGGAGGSGSSSSGGGSRAGSGAGGAGKGKGKGWVRGTGTADRVATGGAAVDRSGALPPPPLPAEVGNPPRPRKAWNSKRKAAGGTSSATAY